MDAGLFLLVPKIPEFSGFEFKLDTFFWGGVEHPQEPGRYVWGQHVEFFVHEITAYLMQILPAGSVADHWKALCFGGSGLDQLEAEVNGQAVDWEGRSLVDAMRQILSRSGQWVVVFAWQYDQIDIIDSMGVEECLHWFQENLRWETTRQGFAIVSRTSDFGSEPRRSNPG